MTRRIRQLVAVLMTFAFAGAVSLPFLAPTAGTSAIMADSYDAIDDIECDLDGCTVTGVNCLPTCHTGFCCKFPAEPK